MGVVYRARHDAMGREVAIKVLLAGEGAGARQRQRFLIEAHASSRLRHPNIVVVHDVGECPQGPYMVMDLVPGGSLSDRIEREGAFDPRHAGALAGKLAGALQYAHEQSILHRDVKPQNVLLLDNLEPLLADFGLAKHLEGEASGPTRTGQILGTPSYMPPEQALGKLVDWRADVYSLGATLYEMLTGVLPYEADSMVELLAKITGVDPAPPSRLEARVPRDLDTICLKCLEKDPAQRYSTARGLQEDLQRFLDDEPILARPVGTIARGRKWMRRNPLATRVGAVAAGLLILGGVGAELWAGGARAEGRARAQAELKTEAQERARAAWDALESGHEASLDERTGLALSVWREAQAWHGQAPHDPDAAKAVFRAALALGDLALEGEQWALAGQAFQQAALLGVDDDLARDRVSKVTLARSARANRHRAEVEGWLARVDERGLALEDRTVALLGIVRYPEAQTVEILIRQVEEVTGELLEIERKLVLEAEEPTVAEARAGEKRIPRLSAVLEAYHQNLLTGLVPEDRAVFKAATDRLVRRWARAGNFGRRAQQYLQRLLSAQGRSIPEGRLRVAGLAIECLGLIKSPRAVPALGRYLVAQADSLQVIPVATALDRVGVPEATRIMSAGIPRFGANSPYARWVRKLLARRHLATLGDEGGGLEARLQTGRSLLLEGKFVAAERVYDQILEANSDLASAWFGKGRALMERDPRVALEALSKAIELNPQLSEAWLNRGIVHSRLGDQSAALRDYDRALKLSPDDAIVWLNRGVALMRGGDLRSAQRCYTGAIKRNPGYAMAWDNRGVVRLKLGDPRGAFSDHDKAIKLDPGYGRAWANRGLVRLRWDPVAALKDLSRAIRIRPGDASMWAFRGAVHFQRQEFERAIADCTKAIGLNKREIAAWVNRASSRAQVGELAGSDADYSQALKLNPRDPALWFSRGLVRNQRGRPQQALGDFVRSLQLSPENLSALVGRALAYRALGRLREALDDLRAANRKAPHDPKILVNLATVLGEMGHDAKAIETLTLALRRNPKDAGAWNNRAAARLRLGRLEGAVSDAARSAQLNPRDANAWCNHAEGLARLGRTDEALKSLEAGLRSQPRHVQSWFKRAMIYKLSGNMPQAIKALESLLEVDPGSVAAFTLRGAIHWEAGEISQALASVERAQALAPSQRNPEALWVAGLALAKLGRPTARQALEQFVHIAAKNHPKLHAVRRALAALKD
jgi:tetratricopeptide (TPR) repeat protein